MNGRRSTGRFRRGAVYSLHLGRQDPRLVGKLGEETSVANTILKFLMVTASQHQDTLRARVSGRNSTNFGVGDGDQGYERNGSSDEEHSESSASTIDFDDLSDDVDGASDYLAAAHVTRYSVIGSYTTFEDALAGLHQSTPHIYVYVTRYESRNLHARIYECRSHVACGHRAKVASIVDVVGDVFYQVSVGGTHSAQATARRRRGIHPPLIQEIDSLLSVGWSGGQLRTLLQLRYRNDEATLLLVPTARQLTNRKAYLMRNAPGGWVITDHATFNVSASTRLCVTRAQFDEVVDAADPRMNVLIVLDTFHFPGEPSTFGAVVTSCRIFRNIATTVEGQGNRLVLSTDGTYKLNYAGWTLIAVGTVRIRWARQQQEFIPWFYVFVRTESAAAYRRVFEVARTMALTFLDVALNVRFATLDHSEPIALALEETWPRVRLLTCWPHVARQTRKRRILLSNVDRYDAIIKPNIDLLHAARSHDQFICMAGIITDSWVKLGEQDYANWFRSVYLVRRWDCWHVNGADEPGIISNKNPIEAQHRVVKRTCSPSARASTAGVLTQIIPRILSYDGENLCPPSVTLVCEGPLVPEMIAKAGRFHESPGNFRRIHQGRGRNRRVIGVLFNSRRYLNETGNVLRSTVTESRARRFSGQVSEGSRLRSCGTSCCRCTASASWVSSHQTHSACQQFGRVKMYSVSVPFFVAPVRLTHARDGFVLMSSQRSHITDLSTSTRRSLNCLFVGDLAVLRLEERLCRRMKRKRVISTLTAWRGYLFVVQANPCNGRSWTTSIWALPLKTRPAALWALSSDSDFPTTSICGLLVSTSKTTVTTMPNSSPWPSTVPMSQVSMSPDSLASRGLLFV